MSIFLLFIEILKSTRVGTRSIVDHVLSFVPFHRDARRVHDRAGAATSTFFLLVVICFVDVVAGFSVSIRTAQRDIGLEGRDGSDEPLVSGCSAPLTAVMTRDFHLPGRSPVYARRGMAATSHPLASLAAIETLRAGGTAADAAVTAVALLGVIEPQMTGIGGDCFCLVAKPGAPVWGYNGSGRTGAAMDIDKLLTEG